MAEHIMGLEIGSSNIKIIEVSKKAATLTVHKFSVIATPRDCINNGVITNSDALKKVIQMELSDSKYQAKKVVAVVQSSAIIIRNAVMDKQPDKLIREILDVKTEEYLPIDRGQYQIDFKVIRTFEDEGKEKNELLLVAAPNSVVLPVASLIKSLRLVPIMINIPSEALENVFGTHKRLVFDTVANALILDIGGTSSTATIISNDQAVLTRSIGFGVEGINNALNEASRDNSILGKDMSEESLSELIRPQIEYNIISEVERILQFYYSNYGSGAIKKVFIIGGGANIKGIRTYIRDALNIPTENLSEFSTVIEAPNVDFEPFRRFFVNILGAINGL